VAFGLSLPRLVTGGLFLAALLADLCILTIARVQPCRLERFSTRIDGFLSDPDRLLAASFLAAAGVMALLTAGVCMVVIGYAQFFRRLAELFAWAALHCAGILLLLQRGYPQILSRKSFYKKAPRRLAAALVLAHLPFWLSLALAALAVAVLQYATSTGRGQIPGHDSGIFLYFGQQILEGKVPFRDLWDHKPPLIFYIDALGLFLGSGSARGVWFLEVLALAASSVLAYQALRRFFGDLPAFLAAAAMTVDAAFLLEGGNLTEEFALPLQWLAVLLFIKIYESPGLEKPNRAFSFITGILFGLALNLKQTMGGAWLAFVAAAALAAWARRERPSWKDFGYGLGGTAAALLGVVAYFASRNALREYWDVAFVYNFLYSEVAESRRIDMAFEMLKFFFMNSAFLALPFAAWPFGLAEVVRGWRRQRTLAVFPLLFALVALPVEALLINTSGKNYRHYFITLLPAAAFWAAWMLARAAGFLRRYPGAVQTAAVLLAAVVLLTPGINQLRTFSQDSGEQTITRAAALIREETQPGDPVLVWGSETTVNYLSGRPAPTRFVHQKPLFRTGYAGKALSDELLRDLQANPPALIINTHHPSTPFITLNPGGSCLPPENTPEGMDAVFDFICKNYRLETTVSKDRWEIYRYAPGS